MYSLIVYIHRCKHQGERRKKTEIKIHWGRSNPRTPSLCIEHACTLEQYRKGRMQTSHQLKITTEMEIAFYVHWSLCGNVARKFTSCDSLQFNSIRFSFGSLFPSHFLGSFNSRDCFLLCRCTILVWLDFIKILLTQ